MKIAKLEWSQFYRDLRKEKKRKGEPEDGTVRKPWQVVNRCWKKVDRGEYIPVLRPR